ncbi:MAG: DUF3054 domain-containing protein [Micrococcales bacterium]|nr:DUF3054 domain-containing protein [Micrococcales bacterium]
MSTNTTGRERRAPGPLLAAYLTDLVLVGLFALMGRAAHEEGLTLAGWLATAWPFLVGLGLGWVAAAALPSRPLPWQLVPGAVVWLSTVVVGMLIRALTGAGTALPFVAVAFTVVGLFLLGWRLVVRLVGFLRDWAERKGVEQVRRDRAADRRERLRGS